MCYNISMSEHVHDDDPIPERTKRDETGETFFGPYRERTRRKLAALDDALGQFERFASDHEGGAFDDDKMRIIEASFQDFLLRLEARTGDRPALHGLSAHMEWANGTVGCEELVSQYDQLRTRLRDVCPEVWREVYGSSMDT